MRTPRIGEMVKKTYHTSKGAEYSRIALAFGPLSRITTVCPSVHYGQLCHRSSSIVVWPGFDNGPYSPSVVQLFRARRVVVR